MPADHRPHERPKPAVDPTDVGRRLEALRVQRGLSVLAFAKHCGVPNSAMRGYLAGKNLPGLENLHSIALATRASLDWLILGEGSSDALDFPLLQEAVETTFTIVPELARYPDLANDLAALAVDLYARASSPNPERRLSIESRREMIAPLRELLAKDLAARNASRE